MGDTNKSEDEQWIVQRRARNVEWSSQSISPPLYTNYGQSSSSGGPSFTIPRTQNPFSIPSRTPLGQIEYKTLEVTGSASSISGNIEDLFFAVMGVTGSGKSTFVRDCSARDVRVGHDLKSCTTEVEDFDFMYGENVRIHLIDTPGFDDTNRSDADVLRDLAGWMGAKYQQGTLLSGIIYLHRVSDPRMSGGQMRNLQMFKKLCGQDCFRSVILVTTFWDMVTDEVGQRNEAQLKTVGEYWGEMLNRNSHYMRHTGGEESAKAVLRYMVDHKQKFKAAIQVEMIDQKLKLNDTEAGQQVNSDLIKFELRQKAALEQLNQEWKQAKADDDERSAKYFDEERRKTANKIEEAEQARHELQEKFEGILKQREEDNKRQLARQMVEMGKLRSHVEKLQEERSPESNEEMVRMRKEVQELKSEVEHAKRRQAVPDTEDSFGGVLKYIGKFLIGITS